MKEKNNRHRQNQWLTPFDGGGFTNFFDDFWGFPSFFEKPRWGIQTMKENNFLPSIDVTETEKEFQITADLPGFDPKDVNVEVEEDGIAINGKHESESKDEDKNYLRCERRSGSFYRKIVMPHMADLLKVKCKSKNGVLNITVPKKDDSKRKSVKIEIED